MFLINIMNYLVQFQSVLYCFGSFAFFGLMLCVRKIVLHKGI